MEVGVRAFIIFEAILLYLLRPLFRYFNRKPPAIIPPAKDDILNYSAVTLARKIRRKELKSETVVRAYIDRIKEVNPFLNAVVEDRFDAAIRDAKCCDDALTDGTVTESGLEKEKPLYGVPITVKESCSLKGMSHTGCTLPRVGIRATSDGPSITSLKNAGAIPLCVTNTPELCLGFETNNYLKGRTNNPYDTRRTPGGSSGGEGALLGCSASLIGIGSDIAGSIRIPAHFNGIFGHKPSPGIIGTQEHYPYSEGIHFQKYLAVGPLARYAEDLILSMKIMSSQHSSALRLDEPVNIGRLNVRYMEGIEQSWGIPEPCRAVKQAIKNAATYLKSRGAEVQEVNIKELNNSLEAGIALFFGVNEMPKMLIDANDPKNEKNSLAEGAKSMLGLSQHTKLAILVKLLKEINVLIPRSKLPAYKKEVERLENIFLNLLGTNGVFLFPTFTDAAPFHGQLTLLLAAATYCLIFNILGLPSTNVPMGFDSDGLPIGIQVIGGPMQDRLCLAVAKELEIGFGGWVPPNKRQ